MNQSVRVDHLVWEPHPKQVQFLKSPGRVVLWTGSAVRRAKARVVEVDSQGRRTHQQRQSY